MDRRTFVGAVICVLVASPVASLAQQRKVWRIGVMGYNAQPARVEKFLGALEEALRAEGRT